MLTRNRCLLASAILGITLCIGTRQASAQLFVYTSQASYTAAQATDATINFDGLVANYSTYTSLGEPGNLTINGVSFTTTNNQLFVVGPNFAGNYDLPNDDSPTLEIQNNEDPTVAPAVSVSLPSNFPIVASAVGAEIGDLYYAGSITATVTLANSSVYQYVYSASEADADGLGFLGFVSTGSPIASITYTDNTNNGATRSLALDNFTYGLYNSSLITGTPVQSAPEPSSIALLALGAGALLVIRRRLA